MIILQKKNMTEIKEIKEKSAPRKDNIDYKMIKELLNCFKVEMIKIFNNI